jgi:hypothetical protein
MKVLILGINYAPELVGIGPYTAGMARFLAEAQHEVTVICAKPYYPAWKVDAALLVVVHAIHMRTAFVSFDCRSTSLVNRMENGEFCIISAFLCEQKQP